MFRQVLVFASADGIGWVDLATRMRAAVITRKLEVSRSESASAERLRASQPTELSSSVADRLRAGASEFERITTGPFLGFA